MVPEDPATGEPGTESSPPFSARLFGFVFRMPVLVFRTRDCPSPTLTVQPESGQLMRSTYGNGTGSMVGPRPLDAEGVLGVIS